MRSEGSFLLVHSRPFDCEATEFPRRFRILSHPTPARVTSSDLALRNQASLGLRV